MEDSGEGMAALRWLSDAGLAFNYLSRIQSRRTQETGVQPALSLNSSSSNAVASQTLSKHHYKRQCCINEPYASTYQVSKGGIDSSTYASRHTDFAPQRQKPSSVPQQSQVTIPPKKRRHHRDKPRPLATSNPHTSRYNENHRRLRRKKEANREVNSKDKEYSVPGGRVSFDSLDSGPRSSAKTMDNKNGSRDIFRHAREPLTAFPACSTIQDRYKKHVKKYHATTSKTPYVDSENLAPCCKCLQKRPCACDTAKDFRRTVDKEEHAKGQFEDAIFLWLEDIPVFPNEDPRDKINRDATVKKLAETLSGLKNEEFAIKGKEKIQQALDKIPMWYPKGEIDRDRLKNNITDNLLEKIKGMKESRKFYETTEKFYDDLQFLKKIDKEQALDNIVTELYKIRLNRPESNDMYRDLLKIKAFELLDRLPIKTNGNIYEYLNTLCDELADNLLNVSTKGMDEVKTKSQIPLSLLNDKVPEDKLTNISEHVLTLANQVKPTDNDPKKVTKEDIRGILDHSGIFHNYREKTEEDLSELLNDIITKGMEEDKAKSHIESLLKDKIPEEKLEDITKRVLNIADQVKPIVLEAKQSTQKDLRSILNISDVQIKNAGRVEEGQHAIKGIGKNQSETQIKSVLKDKVSDNKLEDSKQVLSLPEQEEPIQVKSPETLKDSLNDLHYQTNVHTKKRVQNEESSHDIPSDVTMLGRDTYKAQDYINDSLKQMSTPKDSEGIKSSFMSSTNHLNTSVKDWCEALQIDQGKKQDLANGIMLKIGEINLNQDILNDDLLYDEILQDFIDQQVNELQIDIQITHADKKDLFEQIKQIKQKVQDDFIIKKYKQQLCDTISNMLPVRASPTVEDVASFELMKENLADAFINLNYSIDDDAARIRFKRRIMDEVNKYVKDYLRRYPATPVNTKKLNEDLHNALKNVPVPDDDTMRTEVESVRMKDIINDWLKTLPMNKQSKSEQLHTNKIVTLMAQKLQQLENEFRPDFETIAVTEIALYLKKLPLKNKYNYPEMANKLVEKIKTTAESRAFVEGSRSNLTDDCLCEDFSMSRAPGKTFIPSGGLNIQDQERMQKVTERSLLCDAGTGTQSPRCRDAAVNPPPLDDESQTEMPFPSQYCPRTEKPEHVCSKPTSIQRDRIPTGTRPGASAVGPSDWGTPCVHVKDNVWDSCLDNKVETATQTPSEESRIIFIPTSPLNSECICCPRSCTIPQRVPVIPPSCLEYPTCRRPTPRRRLSSECTNEYFSRPKYGSRLPILEREHLRSSRKHVCPSCDRIRSCELSQGNPTTSRNRCAPVQVCPHPAFRYFK